MRATILMAGLLAGLAGTALLAQTTSPDASGGAAPETGTVEPGTATGATGEVGEGRAADLGPRGHGSGAGVPGLAPLETYDTDGDGIITQAEIEARRAERFAQADGDGDGALSAEELIAMEEAIREEVRQARALAQANEAIARMDDNGDGRLQSEELEARTPRVAPIFDRLDTDNDGGISQTELEADHSGRDGRSEGFGRGAHGQGNGPLGD